MIKRKEPKKHILEGSGKNRILSRQKIPVALSFAFQSLVADRACLKNLKNFLLRDGDLSYRCWESQ